MNKNKRNKNRKNVSLDSYFFRNDKIKRRNDFNKIILTLTKM